MRVLHLPKYPNPYLDLLGEALGRAGVQVEFALEMPGEEQIRELAASGTIVHMHWLHGLYRQTKWLAPLHYVTFRRRVLSMVSRGVPIVWTMHNLLPHERMYAFLAPASRRLMQRHASAIVVHCPEGARQFQEAFGPHPRIRTITQGGYANYYGEAPSRQAARQRLGLPPEAMVFLSFGMIRGYKGLTELIDAFHASSRPQDRLVIAGAAFDRRARQEVHAAQAGSDRVILHARHIENELVPVYYAAADVAVCPFRKVLNSSSVIVAMSFGLPLVAPEMGCIPHVVPRGAAEFYDASQHGGLRQALERIREADLAAMSRESRLGAQRLSWDEAAQQLKQLYEEVLASPRRQVS